MRWSRFLKSFCVGRKTNKCGGISKKKNTLKSSTHTTEHKAQENSNTRAMCHDIEHRRMIADSRCRLALIVYLLG